MAIFILTRFYFGAFLFGTLPLRRVTLWRASTSARFSLARFPILYEPTMIRYLRTPVSRGLFVCMFPFRGEELSTSFCAHVAYLFCMYVSFRISVVSILRACFLSAKNCFLRQFGAYLFLRRVSICAHVSYLRRSVFYVSWTRFSFCAMLIEYASMACSMRSTYVSLLRNSVFMRGSLFCVFFLYVSRQTGVVNTSSQKTRA